MIRRSSLIISAVALSLSFGCSKTATQLVIAVSSDMPLDGLYVFTSDADISSEGDEGEVPGPLPLSFGVEPPAGDPGRRVRLDIRGRSSSQELVRTSLVVPFVEGKSRQLDVFLAAACQGRSCPSGETCHRGKCASEVVSVTQLKDPSPIEPGDAGPVRDASLGDASGPDASNPDVNYPDAGANCVPTSDVDQPDPLFVDANCDGIDGDLSAALFVAPPPLGVAGAPGSFWAPMATVAEAVAAASDGQSIYLALGTHGGPVVINKSVSMFGGYDAADQWSRRAEESVIEGAGPVLAIEDGHAVRLEFLRVHAVAGATAGASVIGVWTGISGSLELTSVTIEADDGADAMTGLEGDWGADGVIGMTGALGCRNCNTMGEGGMGGGTWCGQASGGAGGRGGTDTQAEAGAASGPAAGGVGGLSAQYCWDCACGPANVRWVGELGGDGAAGATGTVGLPGDGAADAVGIAQANFQFRGGTGAAGANGLHGASGAGGGGGGGGSNDCDCGTCQTDRGSGGGGGGGGGCAGFGGEAGHAGGASVGLVAQGAALTFENVTIRSARGGSGGDGGVGGLGGAGGFGGNSGDLLGFGEDDQDASFGGIGGPGGNGGSGGGGGGGAGGASYCVWARGLATMPAGLECSFGIGGRGGLGGLDGDRLQRAGTGVDGQAGAVFVAP